MPFNGEMVRAIIADLKTQTRRIIQPRKDRNFGCELSPGELAAEVNNGNYTNSPYGQPGDHLWVRETFCTFEDSPTGYAYRADMYGEYANLATALSPWTPSIHMPRKAARLILRIESIRAERLRSITDEDAIAEGIGGEADGRFKNYGGGHSYAYARDSFCCMWTKIYHTESWVANPWVWVIQFKVYNVKYLPQ